MKKLIWTYRTTKVLNLDSKGIKGVITLKKNNDLLVSDSVGSLVETVMAQEIKEKKLIVKDVKEEPKKKIKKIESKKG